MTKDEDLGQAFTAWLAVIIAQDCPDNMSIQEKIRYALKYARLKIVRDDPCS